MQRFDPLIWAVDELATVPLEELLSESSNTEWFVPLGESTGSEVEVIGELPMHMRQLYFGIVRLRDQMREAGVLMNAVLDREGAVCWHQLRGQLRQDMRLKDHEYSILEFKSEMLEKAFWLACKMMFGPYGDGMVGVTSDWKLVRKGVECSHESGSPSGLHEGLIKALQLAMLNGSSRVLVSDEGFVELPEPVVGRSNKVAESGLFRPKDGPASC